MSDKGMVKEPEKQPASEPSQKLETDHQQQSAAESKQQLATEQQLPKTADKQQSLTEHKQQQKTEEQQLPMSADEQQPKAKPEKPVGSKKSLRESSKEAVPVMPAVTSSTIMPTVVKSELLTKDYLIFKFKRNPLYVIQCRGVMNVFHLLLSLVMVIMLGVACQLRPTENDSYSGFLCPPAATFIFVTSCGSFFTSVLFFICCMISKETEILLFHTFFEVAYYLFYFMLFLVGSFSLMDRSFMSDEIMKVYMYNYKSGLLNAVSVISLANSVLYGITAFAFLAHHYYYGVFLKAFLNRDEQPCETNSPEQ